MGVGDWIVGGIQTGIEKGRDWTCTATGLECRDVREQEAANREAKRNPDLKKDMEEILRNVLLMANDAEVKQALFDGKINSQEGATIMMFTEYEKWRNSLKETYLNPVIESANFIKNLKTSKKKELKAQKELNAVETVDAAEARVVEVKGYLQTHIDGTLVSLFERSDTHPEVRKSYEETYNIQKDEEKECTKKFEELAKNAEIEEGLQLSNEAKRSLQAVINCPLESKISSDYPPDGAEELVKMARENPPPEVVLKQVAIASVIGIIMILFVKRKILT